MNNRYWYEREALHYKQNLVKLGTYDRRIERLYMRAYAAVEKEIDAFWQKYARDNHLTYADAQKQIDSFDVEAFRSRAKELVKNRDFSPQANRELKLYNATMRLNRLELLKANIGLDLVRDFSEMEDEFKECLNEEAKAEYKRQSGILDDYTQDVPSKVIDSIVGSSFHNATFSDRIWAHQDELRYRLESILVNGLVQGRNPRDFIPQMRKEFGTSRYNAERLLRTEFARVQTDTQMNMFEENGFDEYIFIANGTACKTCASLNGQHFRVSDQQVGKNAPPVHPNCMCSTAAYMPTIVSLLEGIQDKLTHEEAVGVEQEGKVNPGYYSKEKGYKKNCQTCVPVYEARRRGRDLEALPYDDSNAIQVGVSGDMTTAFIGAEWEFTKSTSKKTLLNYLNSNIVDNGRYAFAFNYTKKNGDIGAHAIVAEKQNGGLYLYDPQCNLSYSGLYAEAYIMLHNIRFKDNGRDISPAIFRMDTLKFNEEVLNRIAVKP